MNNRLPCVDVFSLTLLLPRQPQQRCHRPEVARLLNTRYQNTTAECVGEHSAYFCSGVLVRGSAGTGEFLEAFR
jgi:hypothetical protein